MNQNDPLPKPDALKADENGHWIYPEQFERLWTTYPRRLGQDGKLDCYKLFWKAVEKNGAKAEKVILEATGWRSLQNDEFRPGLRSWLRNQKWLEEPPKMQKGRSAFERAAGDLMAATGDRRVDDELLLN